MAPRKKRPTDVALVEFYRAADGLRYTCRDHERKVIWDSERSFRTRRHLMSEINLYFPEARVVPR